MTKKEVFSLIEKEKINFMHLQFVDMYGILKAITIPVKKFEGAIENGVWMDGSSIEGFARICESDMFLKPDLSTFIVTPWEKGKPTLAGRVFCDVYAPDGKPYKGDPRAILKKVLTEAEDMGFVYNVGPELEFFLFKKQYDENGNDREPKPIPHDSAGYFDVSTDLAGEFRKDVALALEEMKVEVEAIHHEVATGQHELDFKYADALTAADNLTKVKYAIKTVADFYDLYATFMPKPVAGINGNGMHVHQSLWDIKKDKNAFFDKKDDFHLSKIARQFVAGQLKHMPRICAVLSPTVNSYKRLVPGYEAPVYISWGQTNRSALIRVPRYTLGRENSVRIELRSPDPSANPYLAFAVMLAAGLDGMKKNMKPPKPVDENIYELDEKKAKRLRISHLPGSLGHAVERLLKSELAKETLGDHTFHKFIEAKRSEWDAYRTSVSQWEIDTYLPIY